MRRRFSLLALLTVALTLLAPAALAATTTVVVNQNSVGTDWGVPSGWQLGDGNYAFVVGPGTPPLGLGSLEMTAPNLTTDKIALLTDRHAGVSISDIEGLLYSTYRAASSTSPDHIVPSINIAITNGGPDGTVAWATLVWEPVYPFPGQVQDDVWQEWDTFAPSQSAFAGGWWSTRTLGTICAVDCFVDWSTVVAQNPHATILAYGVNLGRGPGGSFSGNVDAFSITIAGETTVYDFELYQPTPAERVGDLRDEIAASNAPRGTKAGLDATLMVVQMQLERGNTRLACSQLDVFQRQVRMAEVRRQISAEDAAAWTAEAQAIQADIGCR